MTGDCGVFYVDGKQVGGCYSWIAEAKLAGKRVGKWYEYKTVNRQIKTNYWWLTEDVNKFTVKLYWIKDEKMILADTKEVNRARYCTAMELGKEQHQELVMKF